MSYCTNCAKLNDEADEHHHDLAEALGRMQMDGESGQYVPTASPETLVQLAATLRSQLSAIEAKLAEAEKETRAMTLLLERQSMTAPAWRDGMLLAFDNGMRVTSDGATPMAAAVALATKLGLLDKEGG